MKTTWAGKVRIGVLGVVNGALYSATMLLLIWRWRAASDERNMIEGAISGDYIHLVSNERWVPIVIMWLVAFTSASLVVNYFWRHPRNYVVFWEAVGLTAVAAWNAFAVFGAWFDYHFSGDTMSYSRVTSWHNPLFGPVSLMVVIVVNLIYGYLVQVFCRKLKQDGERSRSITDKLIAEGFAEKENQ